MFNFFVQGVSTFLEGIVMFLDVESYAECENMIRRKFVIQSIFSVNTENYPFVVTYLSQKF